MKKSYFVFLIFTALIAVAYVAWNIAYPSGTWRYKMTVTVETPEGIKTGSAVREVYIYREPQLWQTTAGHAHLTKGEAVVVDLGKRGALFALIGGDYGHMIFVNTFTGGKVTKEAIINAKKYLKAGQKVVLTLDKYPIFVQFRDPNDPKTVENLLEVAVCKEKVPEGACLEDEVGAITIPQRIKNSYIKKDRFAETFGEGVTLKEVTIEMTDEPVTWGVAEKYMPSYRPIEDYMKWVNTLKYSDPRRIGPDSFRKGK